MKPDQLPLLSALWERLPPEVQVAVGVVIDGYERRSAALEAEIAELKERLNQTSQNSWRPPSSDGPHVKRMPPKAPAGRKPGAQPGQGVHQRALEPIRITLTPVGSLALKIPRSAAPSLPPLAKGADRRGAAGEGIFALGHSLTGLFG